MSNLGTDLVKELLGGVLSHVKDPDQLDMIQRASEKVAESSLLLIAADPITQEEMKLRINDGVTVLSSLASAASEDAAALLRNTIHAIVSKAFNVAGIAVRSALVGL